MARRRKNSTITPRKMPAQERSRATVSAILDATARVLVRRGLAGTNTNAVAEVAGVSVGSLYQYFPSKQSLVAALHERHARELLSVVEREIASAAARSFEGTVRALIRAVIEAHLLDPALHRVLETDAAELDAAAALDAALAERVRALLETNRARIAPSNLALATHVVMRIVDTLVHAAVLDTPAGVSSEAIERETVRAVLGYLERSG